MASTKVENTGVPNTKTCPGIVIEGAKYAYGRKMTTTNLSRGSLQGAKKTDFEIADGRRNKVQMEKII